MSDWKNVQYKDGKYRASDEGGGGASALTNLTDVNISSASDGQVLKYDNATNKWVNANKSGGGHIYSTTEQVIGTWIDGKPLYEKTFTGLSQSIRSNNWNIITGISIPYIKDAIDVRAKRLTGDGALADIGLTEYASNVNSQSVQVNPINTQTLNYLIVQYTKTTD